MEDAEDNEEKFDLSPDEATGFDESPPGVFNRKRVMATLSIAFALIIGGGLLANAVKSGRKAAEVEDAPAAAAAPADFLRSLRDQSVREQAAKGQTLERDAENGIAPPEEPGPLLPPVSVNRSENVESVRSGPPPNYQAQSQPQPQAGRGQGQDMAPVYHSPLVPQVEGSFFASRQPPQAAAYNAQPGAQTPAAQSNGRTPAYSPYGSQASEYMQQNDQDGKQAFFDSSYGGDSAAGGRFLGENSVWTGTVIPGILETAVNTDLPGNVLARVTRNIYDSQTGRKLLIPQGTILVAKYNSSVSYAQRRVQIVWDVLIRPDGFQLELDGMNSVDKYGMSGQGAVYRENWFEYIKAAGIITMFSLANARMTEAAAKYADDASASAIAGSNQEFVNQLGGNMVSRAMNIQPTLTVASGTLINVMLNKSLYLPPADSRLPVRKYILE